VDNFWESFEFSVDLVGQKGDELKLRTEIRDFSSLHTILRVLIGPVSDEQRVSCDAFHRSTAIITTTKVSSIENRDERS
jgi:hypothetical protein